MVQATQAVTGDIELGFDSGEGIWETTIRSKAGAQYPYSQFGEVKTKNSRVIVVGTFETGDLPVYLKLW